MSLNSQLDNVDNKITIFSGQTVNLNGDVKLYADQALIKMRAWYTDTSEYCFDMKEFEVNCDAYLNSVEARSPDPTMLNAANNAKDRANTAVDRANRERADFNDLVKKIEQLQ